MGTTEKRLPADMRPLNDQELDQVSGGDLWDLWPMPLVKYFTMGTLNEGLHR